MFGKNWAEEQVMVCPDCAGVVVNKQYGDDWLLTCVDCSVVWEGW